MKPYDKAQLENNIDIKKLPYYAYAYGYGMGTNAGAINATYSADTGQDTGIQV